MNKVLEGMARAYDFCEWSARERKLKAALLWLADNVSDEMVAAWAESNGSARDDIAAALRAAAEGK